MRFISQSLSVAGYNFRTWHKNARIIVTFCLAFILCFLLSDKAVRFARVYGTSMQIVESFIWTFDDANSILLASLLLVLLFGDMPFICAGTPYYLVRITRKAWIAGQIIYIICATGIYIVFVLASTAFLGMAQSFVGNQWSVTAAMLAYSGEGEVLALPSFVRTLESTTPYACMGEIFINLFLYSLLLAFVMLIFNLRYGKTIGVIGAFSFSIYGFLLDPKAIQKLLKLPDELLYKLNVWVGWASPLNHATYHMHSFGYDKLPYAFQSRLIFASLIGACLLIAFGLTRKYNFMFVVTEGG